MSSLCSLRYSLFNFLHLLLNRCDVKLKIILIDCSVFYFTGFRFHAFSRTFPFCCCYFFLVIYIKSTKKMVRTTLSRLLLSEFDESFTKPFIR